jgi:chemotaxis protein methyltransferase CheR
MNTHTTLPINEILNTINDHSGIDFNLYSESITNRIEGFFKDENISGVCELKEKLDRDVLFKAKLIESITIRYTEIFRDPFFFLSLKNKVLPYLSTFPKIKIWIAGCATGEEVYSLAILLHECGLLNRTEIWATDINESSLEFADRGLYYPNRIREYTVNYTQAGGRFTLGRYYSIKDNMIQMNELLKRSVKFEKHNLLNDDVHGEFDLVLCRNVLYYFKDKNQKLVVHKIMQGIRNYGYFSSGISEQIADCPELKAIDSSNKIFRKVIQL